MSWFTFALICMFLSSCKSILAKKLLEKFDPLAFTFIDQLITVLIILPTLERSKLSGIDANFFIILLCLLGPSLISVLSLSQATKIGEISEVSPLLVFLPVFVAITAPLFGEAHLSGGAWLGVGAVVLGSYFLKLKRLSRPFEPFSTLFEGPAARYTWLTVAAGVCAVHLQALLTLAYDARTALFFNSLGITLCLAPRILFENSKRAELRAQLRSKLGWVLLLGVISSSSSLSQFFAYQAGGQVAAVLSIKRVSVLLIGLYGIAVLKESRHLGKIIGLVMMALGGFWLYA